MTKGILVNYEFCTGCHSCEMACKKYLGLEKGDFGIKLSETGPFKFATEGIAQSGKWEWSWLPVLTKACNGCADRVAAGKMPMCVQHCQAWCMEYGDVADLAAKIDGKTRYALLTWECQE